MKDWMTTVSGILGLMSTIGLALISVQIPSALATPALTHYWLIFTFVVTLIAAVSKAVIGFNMSDAHSVPVIAQAIVANGGLQKIAQESVPVAPATLANLVKQ